MFINDSWQGGYGPLSNLFEDQKHTTRPQAFQRPRPLRLMETIKNYHCQWSIWGKTINGDVPLNGAWGKIITIHTQAQAQA